MTDFELATERLVRLAQQHRLTLLTVESCTAGALACALSEVEGAAQTLHGGFVVYTKANKTAALGVPVELIARHTAVSAAVARAMVTGGAGSDTGGYCDGHYRSSRAGAGSRWQSGRPGIHRCSASRRAYIGRATAVIRLEEGHLSVGNGGCLAGGRTPYVMSKENLSCRACAATQVAHAAARYLNNAGG